MSSAIRPPCVLARLGPALARAQTRVSPIPPKAAALCALVLLAVGVAGCGEEEGVAAGASVAAYAEGPLCEGATNQEVEVKRPGGDSLKARIICLPDPRGPQLSQGVGGRRIDLATVGANARRATEDSTTVAFLQTRDPGVNRFTEPILEAAGIGWVTATDRADAMRQLSSLLMEADPSSLRADVREALGQS